MLEKHILLIFFLGEERDTDDIEGKIISKNEDKIPTTKEINSTVETFLGEQEQIPPSFSAIKLQGKKAYESARKGEKVSLKPRKIIVYCAKILEYKYPLVRVEFEVSGGTYIRSLARDIGEKLGTFGFLKDLRRTKIGGFSVEQALTLEEIKRHRQ